MKDFLHLPYPTKDAKATGKAILVNGASSSVGSLAVQLAVASGVKVVATASAHNFDFVKGLGASEVFDYNSKTVVDEVVSALKKCGDFSGAYDAIGLPDSTKLCASVTEKLGGGFIASTLEPPKDLPSGVKSAWCFAPAIASHEPQVADAIWKEYVPAALTDGSLQATPGPIVAGKGLESLQSAMERQKQGVSAAKVVVTLS